MSDYTPSIDDVRTDYAQLTARHRGSFLGNRDEFDRAIAKVRTDAKVEALREAADAWFTEHETRSKFYGVHFTRDWLRTRADNLDKP